MIYFAVPNAKAGYPSMYVDKNTPYIFPYIAQI